MLRKTPIRFALGIGIFFWLTSAMARPQFVNLVPTPFQCETCHDDPRNRQFRNGFGIDFATHRTVWFSDANAEDCPTDCTMVEDCPRECAGACSRDSDGDGLSNGRELGDPDCTWRPGDRRPDFEATMPGDPRDPDRCGDGILDAGEDCDGDALGDESCEDHGFLEGPLGCTANCEYDDQTCDEIPVPDAAIPDAEIPDAALPDLGGPDAADPDFGGSDAAITDFGEPDLAPADSGGLDGGNEADARDPTDAMSAEDGSVPNARVTDAGSDSSQDSEPRAEPDSGGCRLASNAPGAPAPTALALLLFGLFMCRRRN